MDESLTKFLQSLSHDCTEMLDELIKDPKYATRTKVPVHNENGWMISVKEGNGVDYSKMAHNIRSDVRWTRMPSFKALVKAVKDTVQSLDQTDCDRILQLPDDKIVEQVSYFLAQVAREKNTNRHNALERAIGKFRLHVASDMSMHTCISPLYNVKGDVEIVLSERLKIRPVTEDEHARMVDLREPISDMDDHKKRLKYVLSYSCCQEEGLLDNACREYTFVTNLIRLVKDGTPEFGRIYLTRSTNLNVLGMDMMEHYQSAPTSHNFVDLTTEDQEKIAGLYKDIADKKSKTKKTEFYTNAIARFGMACRHRQSPNKIVDFVIALESLLTDAAGESTFKLAHRVSALCGNSDDERLYLWEYMKETYRFRSGVVHSGKEQKFKIGSKAVSMKCVADELSKITAIAILRMVCLLDKYPKQKDVLAELDRCVYDRKKMGDMQKLYDNARLLRDPKFKF